MEWREKKERNRIKVLFFFTSLHLIHKRTVTLTHLSRRKGGILATDRRAIMRPTPPAPLDFLLSSPPDWKVEREETHSTFQGSLLFVW